MAGQKGGRKLSTAKKLLMGGSGINWTAISFGESVEGGFYAGVMRYSDGDYALIISPVAGEVVRQIKTESSITAGTYSFNDGLSNCSYMNTAAHPAAKYCLDYEAGGFSDWYLPARDELELIFRNLKPGSGSNATGYRDETGSIGQNANSVPAGAAYTTTSPVQTSAAAFKTGGAEAVSSTEYYWSSTSYSSSGDFAWFQRFSNGLQDRNFKNSTGRVRPVRRVKI